MIEASQDGLLSSEQAHETAYRFVARYYDYERSVPILRLLEAIAWVADHPDSDHPDSDEESWAPWKRCVQETLDGAPLPELPPPWAW